MRIPLLLKATSYCLALSLLPCIAVGEDELIDSCMGKWRVNAKESVKLLKEQGLPEDAIARLSERIADITLELTKEKQFTIRRPNGEELKGSWKVESEEKDKNELKLTLSPDEEEEPVTLTVTLLEMNTQLKMAPPNQPPVVFDRQPSTKDSDQDK